MIHINAINGSPKSKNSVSTMLIGQMECIVGAEIQSFQAVSLLQQEDTSFQFVDILKSDVLLIVFPLYVDSLPAPLIKVLTLLEQTARKMEGKPPTVYAIVNCGFYEAEHNLLALDMVENFCAHTCLPWGYGIGIGAGGIVAMNSKNIEKGVASSIYTALRNMGDAIVHGETSANVFVRPKFPRFLYKFGGHMSWRKMAKKNGAYHSLDAKPHMLKEQSL